MWELNIKSYSKMFDVGGTTTKQRHKQQMALSREHTSVNFLFNSLKSNNWSQTL